MKKVTALCIAALVGFFTLFPSAHLKAAEGKDKYLLKVNRLANCVTVYEKNKKGNYDPIKAMLCSSGGTNTPLGTFSTVAKYRWRPFYAGSFGQYATRIMGPYLFHSLPYYRMREDTMQPGQFGRLGLSVSAGCVRLSVSDAKWIYDNCSTGTKVEVYESKDPGPLGRPEKVPYEKENGYDPTDIWAKGNPVLKELSEKEKKLLEEQKALLKHQAEAKKYAKKKPKIKVTGVIEIRPEDTEIDFLLGVTAVSSSGKDITENIEVTEDVDLSKPGEYKIKYAVTDEFGKSATAKGTVIVY